MSSSYKLFIHYESEKFHARLTELTMKALKDEISDVTKINESEELKMKITDGEGCTIIADKHIQAAFEDAGDSRVIFNVSIGPLKSTSKKEETMMVKEEEKKKEEGMSPSLENESPAVSKSPAKAKQPEWTCQKCRLSNEFMRYLCKKCGTPTTISHEEWTKTSIFVHYFKPKGNKRPMNKSGKKPPRTKKPNPANAPNQEQDKEKEKDKEKDDKSVQKDTLPTTDPINTQPNEITSQDKVDTEKVTTENKESVKKEKPQRNRPNQKRPNPKFKKDKKPAAKDKPGNEIEKANEDEKEKEKEAEPQLQNIENIDPSAKDKPSDTKPKKFQRNKPRKKFLKAKKKTRRMKNQTSFSINKNFHLLPKALLSFQMVEK